MTDNHDKNSFDDVTVFDESILDDSTEEVKAEEQETNTLSTEETEKAQRELGEVQDCLDELDIQLFGAEEDKLDVKERISKACRSEKGILMLINIDNLVLFNEFYGRETGDDIIKAFETAIEDNVSESDIKGSLGGDEFVVFSKSMGDKVAFARFYGNIKKELSESIKNLIGEDANISVGVSIGAVFVPEQGSEYGDLFEKAGRAMEYIKGTGNSGCAFYGANDSDDGEPNIVDNFESISLGLDGGETPRGALWLDYDYFSIIYRFMRRYINTYKGKAAKMLITVKLTDESISQEDFSEMMRTFGMIVNNTLRKSDLMVQSRKNQLFLLLPEMPEQYIEKVYNRIMNRWNKTDYAKFSEIHCEAGMLVPNDK